MQFFQKQKSHTRQTWIGYLKAIQNCGFIVYNCFWLLRNFCSNKAYFSEFCQRFKNLSKYDSY